MRVAVVRQVELAEGWPELVVGLALVLVLALGLVLTARSTQARAPVSR